MKIELRQHKTTSRSSEALTHAHTKRRFALVGAPFNQMGCVTTRANTAAQLRESTDSEPGLSEWMAVRNARWGADIIDAGDVLPSPEVWALLAQLVDGAPDERGLKDQALARYCADLHATLLTQYRAGRVPLTLGGDHAIAFASVQAALQFYQQEQAKKVAVVWVDAHADCNHTLDSNLHGKPLAMLMNRYPYHGWSVPVERELAAANLFYVGVRDMMPCEYALIRDLGITCFDMALIEQLGFGEVVRRLCRELERDYDHVYLSFDYDALDGSLFRACATPNVGGLSAREALHLVHSVASCSGFIGADFVEYLPERDPDAISKALMVKLMDAVWGYRI